MGNSHYSHNRASRKKEVATTLPVIIEHPEKKEEAITLPVIIGHPEKKGRGNNHFSHNMASSKQRRR